MLPFSLIMTVSVCQSYYFISLRPRPDFARHTNGVTVEDFIDDGSPISGLASTHFFHVNIYASTHGPRGDAYEFRPSTLVSSFSFHFVFMNDDTSRVISFSMRFDTDDVTYWERRRFDIWFRFREVFRWDFHYTHFHSFSFKKQRKMVLLDCPFRQRGFCTVDSL